VTHRWPRTDWFDSFSALQRATPFTKLGPFGSAVRQLRSVRRTTIRVTQKCSRTHPRIDEVRVRESLGISRDPALPDHLSL
jgi:hypothetical protein